MDVLNVSTEFKQYEIDRLTTYPKIKEQELFRNIEKIQEKNIPLNVLTIPTKRNSKNSLFKNNSNFEDEYSSHLIILFLYTIKLSWEIFASGKSDNESE